MENQEQVVETVQQNQSTFNPFGGDTWTEELPQQTTVAAEEAETAQTTTTTQETTTVQEEEILDPKDWLKREFEVDDAEIIKQQLKEYRELKEKPQTQAELKFENEQSKHLHELIREGKTKEVREFLEKQERLNNLTSAEINEDNAADIIKMNMKLKYKDLSDREIEYKYNKQFAIPREPVQSVDELDEDFAVRKAEWQEQVNDIKMSKIIEAKLARPDLEKSKAEIKLPEIAQRQAAQQEPNQESLAALEKLRENFINALESNYTKVEGFKTKVKDESVEIPIQFKIPDEDKVAYKGRLSDGMDVNDYMEKRWFDEKGGPKVEQIISDLYQLENMDKILSGVANNAASERLKEYIKSGKNLNVSTTFQQTFQPNQNGGGNPKLNPYSQGAWSESPVTVTI